MTLLELLVGLVVTGVAVSAGYGAFTSIVDHRVRAEAQLDSLTRAAAVRRMLGSWLSGARLTVDEAGPSFRGLDGSFEGTPDDELTFLSTATRPGQPRELVVRLYIDRDTLTPERGLTAELSIWPSTESERVEIEPSAGGLDFRYFTRTLGSTEWLPSWISSTVLPGGVELTLMNAQEDTLPALLRLPIVVPLGAGR